MYRVTRITSTANARVKHVVKLGTHRHRRQTGLFVAEGKRHVARAAAAGLACRETFFCPDLGIDAGDVGRLLGDIRDCALFQVDLEPMRKMAYLREPEGLLAVFEQPHFDFDGLPPVDAHSLFLVAVGMEKPGNLGAMIRTADAAGCQAVFVTDGVVDAFNPNTIRTATGAVFSLPTIAVSRRELFDYFQAHAVRMLAAVVGGPTRYDHADYQGPLAIIIGPEDTGLDDAWRQAVHAPPHAAVAIPMHGRSVDSLNAANAAAILLFEAIRQHSQGPPA